MIRKGQNWEFQTGFRIMNNIQNCMSSKIINGIKNSSKTYIEDEYTEYEPVLINLETQLIIEQSKNFDYDLAKDALYYKRLKAELDHIFFKWREGWIGSRRQLILSSEDCISSIHMVFTSKSLSLNIFQRSSNIDNALNEDISFFCKWLVENSIPETELLIHLFISIPHTFGNIQNKINQDKK